LREVLRSAPRLLSGPDKTSPCGSAQVGWAITAARPGSWKPVPAVCFSVRTRTFCGDGPVPFLHLPRAMPLRRPLAGAALLVLCPLALSAQQRVPRDPVTLANEGAAALEARRFGEALEAFTEAARLMPRDPSLAFGVGLAAFMMGQNDEAEVWFERSLKLDPRFVGSSLWLGELQYREGRIKEAIATYESALKRSPDAQQLEDRLVEWRKETELHDKFYESRGAHFIVLFEGPADEALARRIVEYLEEAYWRVGSALTAYPPKPITVVLYTTEQFRDITRLPTWTAAAYDGRIRMPVRGALEQSEQLDRVLTHEFVHAVVAMLGGRNVPVWLNEGLASVFEPAGVENAERVLARTSGRPPLQQLHGSFFGLSAAQAAVAYAFSTFAVQRMIDLRGAPAVVQLLQDVARGGDFPAAFQQRIAMRYEDFQLMVSR
ncbi:MAG: tetratricopeptide repeat protein, partial [Vicinamibacterales bacterium]